MPVEIAAELPPQQRGRVGRLNVRGMIQARDGLTPQMPEQPLFRDAFRYPAHEVRLHPGEYAASFGVAFGLRPPPFAFSFREHRRKTALHARDDPGRAILGRLFRIVRNFAVQLVPVPGNWHQVHNLCSRIGFTRVKNAS